MIAKESPLEGMNMGTVATVAIRELPGLNTIDLRVAPGPSTLAAVAEALGMDLAVIGRSEVGASGGEAYTLCLAPDWWLIVGLQEAEQKLAPLLLKNHYHFSAVDVSGQRTTIELEGPKVREVLAHLWDQDLREKSFCPPPLRKGKYNIPSPILYYKKLFFQSTPRLVTPSPP